MAHKILIPAATTFVLLLLSLSSPTTVSGDSNLVLDVLGNPLEAGTQYYIHPVGQPFNQGLGRTLTRRNSFEFCPDQVGISSPINGIQAPGEPATFSILNENENQISLSSNITIDFPPKPHCRTAGTWGLRLDEVTRRFEVLARRFHDENKYTFKITQAGSVGYKITHCPASPAGVLCRDLGVFVDTYGARVLGLTDSHPLVVVFIKVNTDTTSATY